MDRNEKNGVVEKVVNGGFGLVRTGEGVVFLKYAAPGERVTFRIREKAKGILWGEILKRETDHPDRVEADCRYYGSCGGCSLSHLNYHAQMKIKEEILADDLGRIGKLDFRCAKVIESPEYHYRVRAKFKGLKNGKIGFVKKGTNEVMAIDSCRIVAPEINEFVKEWNSRKSMQFFHQLDLLFNPSDNGMYVHITGIPSSRMREELNTFNNTVFSWNGNTGHHSSRLSVAGFTYTVSPDTFFQVNRFQWENMLNTADSWLTKSGHSLDLYSGSGFFIPLLLKVSQKVTGVESSGSSVKNARLSFPGAEFIRLPVEKFDLPDASLILTDPPRSGIPETIVQKILKLKPETLIYVSCSSATLARDLGRFTRNHYSIRDMVLLDLFPQTSHFETMTLLKYS